MSGWYGIEARSNAETDAWSTLRGVWAKVEAVEFVATGNRDAGWTKYRLAGSGS